MKFRNLQLPLSACFGIVSLLCAWLAMYGIHFRYAVAKRAAMEEVGRIGGTVYENKYGISISFGGLGPPRPADCETKIVVKGSTCKAFVAPDEFVEAAKSLRKYSRVGFIDLYRLELTSEDVERIRARLVGTRVVHARDYIKGLRENDL